MSKPRNLHLSIVVVHFGRAAFQITSSKDSLTHSFFPTGPPNASRPTAHIHMCAVLSAPCFLIKLSVTQNCSAFMQNGVAIIATSSFRFGLDANLDK